MASLTTTVGAEFTPAVGYFIVRVSGGQGRIMRKNSSGDSRFEPVQGYNPVQGCIDVYQAISGAVYKVENASGTQQITIAVDQ